MTDLDPADVERGTARLLEVLAPVPADTAELVRGRVREVLSAVLPDHDARVREAERARIDAALRAMPCPDPERPGAAVMADRHYQWMTEVLRVVHTTTPTTEGDHDA